MKRGRVGSLLHLILISILLFAGIFAGGKSACAQDLEGQLASSSESSSTSSSASSKQERLAPLDMWEPIKPIEKKSSSSSAKSKDEIGNDYLIIDDGFEEIDAAEAAERLRVLTKLAKSSRRKSYTPTRKGRKRLAVAIQKQRKRILAYRRDVRKRYYLDSRAEAEFRVCTLNFNYYGMRAEIKRILKKGTKSFVAKENSLINAIDKAKCDIVAVQGLIGRDRKWTQKGFDRFSRKLAKATGQSWDGLLGESNHRLVRSGFLLKRDSAQVVSLTSHTDKILPRFGAFVQKKFSRSPLELILRVAGKDRKPTRLVSLISMDFEKGMSRRSKDGEVDRMQMAEALRQLAVYRKQVLDSTEQKAVVIVLGSRVSRRYTGTARILEGSLKLTDFKDENEPCSIGENDKIECNKPIDRAKTIFGVFSTDLKHDSNFGGGARGNLKMLYGKKAKLLRNKNIDIVNNLESELYVVPEQLRLFRKWPEVAGRYATGVVKVRNGLINSPLLWAEINW